MPELPDILVHLEALESRIVGHVLERLRLCSPFVLRSVEPPISEAEGRKVAAVRRLGKRLAISLDNDVHLVIHLMIAGRLRWMASEPKGLRPGGKATSAEMTFSSGVLLLTEAGTKKRASLHLVRGEDGLAVHRPAGIEVLESNEHEFVQALRKESRTLKRALTNPDMFSGIGNAYSDEILHAARLSPLRLTHSLSDEEASRLYKAAKKTLRDWTATLRAEFANTFPGRGDITAFRKEFAVHGKFGSACPLCGKPVQRIRYAENETNYCAQCQNEGRLLADRALSRLLKSDWPKTLEELEGG